MQNSSSQPLPFLDADDADRIRGQRAGTGRLLQPQAREQTAWYRLVTALSSCYVYAVTHTSPETCTFEIEACGLCRCRLSDETEWELTLPEAAYRQFLFVVELWRRGALAHCLQVDSVRLGEPRSLSAQMLAVDILPALARERLPRTVAR